MTTDYTKLPQNIRRYLRKRQELLLILPHVSREAIEKVLSRVGFNKPKELAEAERKGQVFEVPEHILKQLIKAAA